jgi:hypothetical protein
MQHYKIKLYMKEMWLDFVDWILLAWDIVQCWVLWTTVMDFQVW